MIILLDCDGVICNFVDKLLEFDEYEHTHESITDFNIFKAWNQVERWKDFTTWVSTPGKVLEMKPFDGAKEFVDELRKLGTVYIATSPFKSPNWIPERLEWLETNFGFKADDVCVWSKKHLIHADILIDDALHNALEFSGKVLLLNAPWNQSETLPSNVTRCFSFDDIRKNSNINNYRYTGVTCCAICNKVISKCSPKNIICFRCRHLVVDDEVL